MINEREKFVHWNYFLAFDVDAEKLSRYIEFTADNFEAYSIEMARLLLSAASEVDVVAKLLCSKIDSSSRAENIRDYREILNTILPKIKDMKVHIRRHGLELTPWDNWKHNRTPDWWTSYNDVKHARNINFRQANLKNTLNAIAGLFCLLLYYHKAEAEAEAGDLIPNPNLFILSSEFLGPSIITGGGFRITYRL